MAKKHFDFFAKSGNKNILKKIDKLLIDIEQDPYSGIGKPEALKHELSGFWSRRIDKEHRLLYVVFDNERLVEIISFKGHYEK